MEKKIDKLHLVYCVIICLIIIFAIIVCWVLTSKNIISEYAFDNFAFASTIVSIVLAVVSIIYTIYSGSGVTNSIGVLKNVEESISKQLETMEDVENIIKKSICKERQEMEHSLSDIIKSHLEQLFIPSVDTRNSRIDKKNGDVCTIDIHNNTPLGNVFLYCCFLSIDTKKPWNLEMPNKFADIFFSGYIAALKSIPSVEFTYQFDKKNKTLSHCGFSKDITNTITSKQIRDVLVKQLKEYPDFVDIVSRIDNFFDVYGPGA